MPQNKKTSFLAWNIFDFLEKHTPLTDTHILGGVEVKSPCMKGVRSDLIDAAQSQQGHSFESLDLAVVWKI